MRHKSRLLGCLLGIVAVGSGCARNTLFFTTYTKIGLSASAVKGVPTHLQFGYDRFEGAIVPVDGPSEPSQKCAAEGSAHEKGHLVPTTKKRAAPEGKPTEANGVAPSVLASIDIDNRWFRGVTVKQVFATGDAAVRAASEDATLVNILKAMNKK